VKKALIILVLLSNIATGQTKYQKDFEAFWSDINSNYAYLKQQNIDWPKVKEIYTPEVAAVKNNEEFIRLLETVLNELYNGHSSLNVNLKSSNRLTPTGSDLYVEKIKTNYVITDIRKDFGADKSGLKTGMQIVKFNDKEIGPQLEKFLPKYTKNHSKAMHDYAMAMLFAGTHDSPRKITILENGVLKEYFPDSFKIENSKEAIEFKKISESVGYIKINNSLGDTDAIAAFDKAMDNLSATKTLIMDLTETPSGGTTTVARAMMGRFTGTKLPYQQHVVDESEFETQRNWVEYVVPRKIIYTGKVFIMVGHWTGSMGEGIAIGFDGMNKATVVGTQMSGLIGAIDGFELPETKIRFQIPTERIYHINQTPREDYLPKVLTANSKKTIEQIEKITNSKL
jgi:C-terminal processing protease CtpA/Prc